MLTIATLLSLTLLLVAGSVAAQNHFGRGFGDFDKRGMHRRNLENLRLLKLFEVLDLDDEQNAQFIAAYSKFRNNSREIKEKVENEVNSLAEYLKQEDKSNDIILKKVDLIVSYKEEFEQERKKFFEEIKGIITPEQLGKMTVFHERFEREMLEKVRGFRAPEPPDTPDRISIPEIQPAPDIPDDAN
jgi:Spy/CpxP family protein refolding chaperone